MGVETCCPHHPDRSTTVHLARADATSSLLSHQGTTIPSDGVVLSIHKSALNKMTWLKDVYLGMEMQLKSNVPQGWESFPYLLGGGPMLLKQGQYVLDAKSESFGSHFGGANARTAVGRTAAGDSVIIVVDKGGAGGCSWSELASIENAAQRQRPDGLRRRLQQHDFVKDNIVNARLVGSVRVRTFWRWCLRDFI